MRIPLLCCVLVASVGPAAPVPKPSPAKSPDADALVGRWVIVTRDSGSGHTRQINDGGTFTVEIKDGEISAGTDDQKWFASRPFTLDTTQSPRQIDIQMKRDSDRLGIYQLDGDTLTWCVPFHADLPRPTEFKGADGRPCYVLKRVKSETTGK